MNAVTSVRATLSRSLRHLLPAALALATATCTQDSVGPSDTGVGYFTFRPSYQLAGGATLAQFGIVADSVRVLLTRPVAQVVLDTTVFFPADSTELRLALPIQLQQSPDTLDAVIEMSAGGVIIFRDSIRVEVLDGPPSAGNIPSVVFEYVGPGTNIADIDITPNDTTITLGDTIFLAAAAVDSLEAPVTSFYVGWSTSDTTVARINASGRLIASTSRGTVRVVGITPTGIADSTTLTIAPVPVIITADSGNAQGAAAGDSLPALFVARVKGSDSLGIAGIPVRFVAMTAGGAVRDTLVITDATGRAKTRGVLGSTAGAYSYTATAMGTGLPARTFTATATTGAATAIAIQGGNTQVDSAGRALPTALTVRVADAFDNPVANAKVYWTRTSGSGVVAPDSSLTNATGIASASYTLGAVGVDSITALLAGTSASVSFQATAINGAVATLNKLAGDLQSDTAAQPLVDSLVVELRSATTQPVVGAPVVWTVLRGGSLSSDTTLSDAAGRAAVAYTAGSIAGTDSVRATAEAVTATFTATVVNGSATAVTIVSGNAQVDTVAQALPLPFVVHVTDAFTNPVAGAAVVFARVFGTGTLAGDTVFTDATGDATIAYTLGGPVGTDSVTATIAGTSAFALFHARGIAGTPTHAQEFDGGGQTIAVNTQYPESLVVMVFDAHDNPTPGAQVVWSIFSGEGTLGADTTIADSTGRATNALTAGTVAGQLQVEARPLPAPTGITITNDVTAGAASSMTIASGNGQSGPAGSPLPLWPEVRVADAFNNPIAGVTVAFAVVAGGGSIDSATATTDSTGRANSGEWVLGVAGLNTVRAISAAVPADTLLFDATAIPAGTTKTWTGASSNLFTDPSNWSPAGAPGITDNIFVPAAAASPLLNASTTIGDLVIENGATLTANALFTVSGNIDIGGTLAGTGAVTVTGSGATFRGTINNPVVNISANRTLSGTLSAAAALNITSGSFTVGGHTLTVGTTLAVSGSSARFVMGSVNDSVTVNGNYTVSTSTSGTGDLTAGVLVIKGNFNQSSGAATGFAPSGTHRTRFLGSSAQTVAFANPGSAFSRFQEVEFGNAAGVTLNSTVTTMGIVTVSAGTVTGIGRTMNIGGGLVTPYASWQVSNTLWGQDPTVYPDSLPRNVTVFNGWTLSKAFKTDSNLVIQASTGILTLNGHTLRVGGGVTQGGVLRMQDTADTLDVAKAFLVNSGTSGVGDLTDGVLVLRGAFTQTAGAADNFAADSTHRTRFAGTAAQTFTFASAPNGHFGAVEFDNAAGVTTGAAFLAAGDVTVTSGTATGAGQTASIGGDLATAPSGWSFGTTNFTAVPSVLPDTFSGNVQFQLGATLGKDLTVGNVVTTFNGLLDINGHTLTAGTVSLSGGGQLHMVNPADSVDVTGFGVSTAASGVGHYTAGVLILRDGNFVQAGDTRSFYASGTHIVRFAGVSPQTMFFVNPDTGASRFARLELQNPTSITANSNIAVAGPIIINDGVMLGAARTAFLGGGGIYDTLGGRWSIGTTVFQANPAALPSGLPGNVIWRASGSLSKGLTVGGAFTIDEDTLYLGGHALQVVGALTVGGTGVLPMVLANDSLIVTGNVLWSTSRSHSGLLTAGHFLFTKDFTQSGATADNFAADAGLNTFIASTGTAPQVTFADPIASHFGALGVSSINGVNLATDVSVLGEFSEGNGTPLTVFSGLQHTLRVGGLDVDGATFDRVNVELHAAANALTFDNVTFLNQDASIIQLSLELPGNDADTLKLDGVTFSGVPTTGQYVFVADSVADDANALVAFYNSSPLNGESFTGTEGSVGDAPTVLWSRLEWQLEPTAGTEGIAFAPAPEVRAVDPGGNLLTGFTGLVTLQFFLDPSAGAATLSGNAENAVSGVATYDALVISMAGTPYALRASSPGLGQSLATSSFTVDLPEPVGTTTAFNNGGGDNDWSNAANWTFGVPDSADNVFILPGQSVAVNSPAAANKLSLGSGAGVLLNAPLTVDSSVVAGNTISGGGQLVARGTGQLSGQVGALLVTGVYNVPGSDQLTAQSITISGAGAALDPGQSSIQAGDSLRTEAGGVLNIGYPGAWVDIDGIARFTGGPSSLTDGELRIGGDFVQEETAGAFAPATGFQTIFDGGGVQTATFSTPDSTSDHFAHLRMENGGTLHLAGIVPILGDLDLSGGTVVVDSVTFVAGSVSGSTGAYLQGNTLQVAGNLGFGGVYSMVNTVFVGTGQTILPLSSGYDSLSVTGTALLGGNITANAVFVFGDGQLSMGGRRLDVAGDFGTFGNGAFGMQDAADTLMVGGSFYAAGGSTTGLLTAGLLQVAGSFFQGNYIPCCLEVIVTGPMPAGNSFDADPGMTTRLTGGSGDRLVFFANPVQPPGTGLVFGGNTSKFGDLELVDGRDSLVSVVPVAGTTTITGGELHDGTLATAGPLVVLPGVAAMNVTSLYTGGGLDYQAPQGTYTVAETFFFGGDSIPVLPYQWLRVGFANMALTGDLTVGQVTLGGQGEGPADSYNGDLDLNGHTLTVGGEFRASGFGRFRMASPADSLDVSGNFDIAGGPMTGMVTDGAIVARAGVYLSPNWTDTSFVAEGSNRFIMDAGGPADLWISQQAGDPIRFADFGVAAGTTVNFDQYSNGALVVSDSFGISGFFLQAASGRKVIALGDLYVGISLGITVDTVEVHEELEVSAAGYSTQLTRYAGAGQVIASNVSYNDLEVTGSAALGAHTSVNGDVRVAGNGQLTIGAFTLGVPGTFKTLDSGTVVMTDPASEIDADTALFAGGSTAGLLSAGTLRTRALIQDNPTSDLSYFANGTHVTQIGTPLGGPEYRIQMATGDLSRSRIKHLLLADGGVGSVPTRIVGRVTVVGKLLTVSEGSGGIIGDPGAFLSVNDSLIVQDPATDIAIDTLELYGGIQIPNNTLASGVVRFMIGGQVIPDSQSYAGIEVWGNVGVEPAVIAQQVRVLNNGRITINSGQGLAANVVRTEQLGTLEMAGPTAQLQVLDTLVMAGGSTAGLLRQGFLTLGGDLVQDGTNSAGSFAVDSQMYTFFTNPAGQVVTFTTPGDTASHFGFVNLQPGAAVSINASGTVPVWGEMNVQSGANLGSNAGIDVAQNMVSGSGSMVTAPLFIFRTGSAPDPGTTWNVARTAFAGADTLNVPQVSYLGDVEIWTLGRFVYPLAIAGTLRIGGAGTPAYASWSGVGVSANGLDVIDNSRFGMTGSLDSLLINGTAHFDGGYLADQLTGGTIVFGGDIVQDSTFLTQSFGASGTQLEFTPTITHKLTFASPDNSPWPYMTTGGQGGDLNILIAGRLVVAGGGLSANGLILSGDTLENSGPLDPGGSQLTVNLQKYVGESMGLFVNVGAWNVTTTHFTGGGGLPYSADFTFDTLIVSGPVQGQLSQLLKASYVEVTGPGNPRHIGDVPGELALSGGDGNTTLDVSGDVVVRGTGAHISSYEGDLLATGDLTVDQDGYLVSGGSFGGGNWNVTGNVLIDGASTIDSLVRGNMSIGKNFTQLGSTSGSSYAPDATFTTVFAGGGTHVVSFQTPTVRGGGGSYFGSLAFEPDAGLVMQTDADLFVEGRLTTTSYANPVLQNTAPVLRTITVREVDIQGVTFDHLQLHLENSSSPAVANIDIINFQNFLTTEDQFLVTLPGQAAGGYSWSNFTFTQLDLGGADPGHYIVATDWDGSFPFLGLSIGTNQASSGELGYYVGLSGATVTPFSP